MKNKDSNYNLSIGNYISIFYRIGASYLSQKYQSYGIGYGQYQFLITLYFEDGLSQDELTKRIAVDKATTARAINKLKEVGYVTVKIDSVDKRVHRVMLTEKALEIKNEILEIATQWEKKLLTPLTDDDKETVQLIFKKIAVANNWIPEHID